MLHSTISVIGRGRMGIALAAALRAPAPLGRGSDGADAELMFVGEAPGANEDKLGLPFVGRAGQLLETLLGEIGLARDDVFIANTLKCRPPGNRDPLPLELENCRDYLLAQLDLIQPKVVCTLGNFATKLLRDDATGITRLHGQAEIRTIGARTVRLYPLLHPAAALYTRSNVEVLREDFARIPELLALPAPRQHDRPADMAADEVAAAETPPAAVADPQQAAGAAVDDQLDLF